MRGLEKLTYVRLAEALGRTGSLPQGQLTEVLRDSDRTKCPMPEILIRDNLISEWELLRLVSDHFSLPVIFPLQVDLDRGVFECVDQDFLRLHNLVPLGRFGEFLTLVMPILTPFHVLEELQRSAQVEVFPYTGPISENSRILMDNLSKSTAGTEPDNSWEKLFDQLDATIQGDVAPGEEEAGPALE